MNIDPNATKYMVKAKISADGIIDRPDVVGAIFGQTEGLLGDELDLRDLQKSGRIGRIEVETVTKGGKSEGIIYMSSSLDQVETVILASALETVDRVGPCKASVRVLGIEDVRVTKREKVVERAKELLNELMKQSEGSSSNLLNSVKQSVQVEEITTYGPDRCPAGPNVKDSEAIIIVEGRSDVLNLLRAGIKNAIAVEGTNIPETVQELSREKVSTAFVDGDRGGELILRELFQVAEIDFVARAPRAHEVEELSAKQLTKCLRNKVPGDQYMEMNGLMSSSDNGEESEERPAREHREERRDRRRDREDREDRSSRDHNKRDSRDRDRKKDRFNSDAADRYRKKDDEETSESEESDDSSEEPVVERELRKARTVKQEVKEDEPAEESSETEEVSEKKLPGRKKKDAARQTKTLSEEQQKYRDMLLDMASTHNAKLLDNQGEVIKEVAVKNLVDTLKENSDGVATIIFDGVISQRIMDVVSEKQISTVVGTRKGTTISKMPAGITVWTKEDLY